MEFELPELGSNLMLYAAVGAAILPALVAKINSSGWSSEVKGIVSAIAAILAGAGLTAVAGEWNGEDMMRTILVVLFLSQWIYQLFWKPTGIAGRLERKG